MSPGDWINAALLLVALAGIWLTYRQVKDGASTQRAVFLRDLYSTLTADPDIAEAYYQVEYGKFSYDEQFHRSTLEPKLDRLLGFADLVSELQRVIRDREMLFFKYRFLRLARDPGIQEYLGFLEGVYRAAGTSKKPFHSFQLHADQLRRSTPGAAA